jgi:hypothetical protein
MAYGMFGEVCLQYHLSLRGTPIDVYRTSAVRGSTNDMVGGFDIYTVHRETNAVSKFQVKTCKINEGDYITRKVDYSHYKTNGVNFLALVETRKEVIVLRLEDDTLTEKEKNKFYFNKDLIVMREPISDVLKNEVCFELFVYCSKKDLTFNLEVGEETNVDFKKEEKVLTLTLPKISENFNQQSIIDGWKSVITQIEDGEEKETSLKNLEKFVK